MSEDARNTLQRALRDLDDGVRALLGQEPTRLGIVRELLGPRCADARSELAPVGSQRRASASHPSRPRRRPARRRPGSPTLVLVK